MRTDAENQPTTYNILFVCTGNTCRSPMAEVLARRELERRGWKHVQVASAGTSAEPGHGASAHAATVARRYGLDLHSHASRPLSPELLEWADLILVMSPSHLAVLDYYGAGDRAMLLGAFAAGPDGEPTAVLDPFGRDEGAYESTFRELGELISRSLDRLTPILQP